jgi:hypothetical protein
MSAAAGRSARLSAVRIASRDALVDPSVTRRLAARLTVSFAPSETASNAVTGFLTGGFTQPSVIYFRDTPPAPVPVGVVPVSESDTLGLDVQAFHEPGS